MKSLIYSKTCEYAIRAVVHLARYPAVETGGFVARRDIARAEHIPVCFLLKVLQQLSRKGLVHSSKGPRAGFALSMDPASVRLVDVVHAIDGVALHEKCAMGYSTCSCQNPCAMHDSWQEVRTGIFDYLHTTVAEIVRDKSYPGPASDISKENIGQ
jgi:Rrf2 family protein